MSISEPTKIDLSWLPTMLFCAHGLLPLCAHAEMLMMNMTCQILTQSTHVYTHMHTRTHTHARTRTHARTHTHTHHTHKTMSYCNS